MGWIAAAAAVAGNLLSSSQQSGAAQDAANTTAAATNKATALQERMYKEGIERQQPFYQAGVNALGQYVQGVQPGGALTRGFTMADYQADPGYAFRLSEGLKGLEQTAAARGGLLSGNALRGAQRYGQDLASQEYTNAYNRYTGEQATQRNALAGLAGQGQTTANTIGQSGAAYGQYVGNAMMNQGANQANAGLIGANANASAYRDIGSILGKQNYSNMFSSTPSNQPTNPTGFYP
jgi:hypothetical protein